MILGVNGRGINISQKVECHKHGGNNGLSNEAKLHHKDFGSINGFRDPPDPEPNCEEGSHRENGVDEARHLMISDSIIIAWGTQRLKSTVVIGEGVSIREEGKYQNDETY